MGILTSIFGAFRKREATERSLRDQYDSLEHLKHGDRLLNLFRARGMNPFTSTFGVIGGIASFGWRLSNSRGIMGSALVNSTRFGTWFWTTNRSSSRHGMSTVVSVDSRIDRVEVTDETITAHLVDGR